MRVSAFTLVLALLCCGSAFAQDEPRVEVFGGYSYLNVDTNGLTERQSANGWEVSVAGNFNRRFALEGSVAGYYKTYSVDATVLGLVLLMSSFMTTAILPAQGSTSDQYLCTLCLAVTIYR